MWKISSIIVIDYLWFIKIDANFSNKSPRFHFFFATLFEFVNFSFGSFFFELLGFEVFKVSLVDGLV